MQSKISELKPLRTLRILIVEDDQFILRLYSKWLTAAGAEVTGAHDGTQGLLALEEKKIDLVLLDLGMPGLNGYETLLKIREKPPLKDLPVIILTNTTVDEKGQEYAHFEAAGVKDILQKYKTSLTEIVTAINAYFKEETTHA